MHYVWLCCAGAAGGGAGTVIGTFSGTPVGRSALLTAASCSLFAAMFGGGRLPFWVSSVYQIHFFTCLTKMGLPEGREIPAHVDCIHFRNLSVPSHP
jgi:hypothetical protein